LAKKVKALIIDDELAVLESFKMILGIKDYEVDTAQNLEQAVSAVQKDQFDVAFIDLRFYGKDIGLDILKKIKEVSPKVECIIVTAFASEKTKMDALQAGAFEYISKPFMMEIIYDLVDRVVAKHSGR
jgi:DNA-binding NtrC family response regulator